jgi:hypothetical protein
VTEYNDTGGANPAYQGYDYQKLVTIWVALKLIFGPSACTDEVIVEPAPAAARLQGDVVSACMVLIAIITKPDAGG